jgi:flagellar biosynthetic protein FliR
MDIPVGWAVPQVIGFMLVVARLSGLFLVTPVFSSPMIPVRIKTMALATLAAMLTPIVAPHGSDVPAGALELFVSIGTEVLIGLALGYSVSLVFAAIQVAASMIDTSIGFSMATIVDPTTRTQGAVLGSFYSMIATLCFLSIGAHQWLLMGFKHSYDTVPIGAVPDIHKMLNHIFATFGDIFGMAFQIAAPVLITLLLCDVVLGIVSRVTPQMNVFFVGVPLKIGVGLAALIIALPSFTNFFEARISDVVQGAAVIVGGSSHDTKAAAGEVSSHG